MAKKKQRKRKTKCMIEEKGWRDCSRQKERIKEKCVKDNGKNIKRDKLKRDRNRQAKRKRQTQVDKHKEGNRKKAGRLIHTVTEIER